MPESGDFLIPDSRIPGSGNGEESAFPLFRWAVLGLLSAGCIAGHLLVPPELLPLHELLFKATYLPIVLSALWFGRRSALLLSSGFALLYLFHIFGQLLGHMHHQLFPILAEVGLYFLLAAVTGTLADRQKARSRELRLRSEELDRACRDLREKTSLLLEFERRGRETERLRLMGEMAAAVAHEVRTPLAALQGAVEIVASEEGTAQNRRRFAELIFVEIRRISGVIEGFLSLGKDEGVEKGSSDLAELVRQCRDLIEPLLRKKGAEIVLSLPERLPVEAGGEQVKQVLLNLLLNAHDALPERGGRILIEAQESGEVALLRLSDNGRGIDSRVEDRLFEAFATTKDTGTGLGLYLSRGMVRGLGGELRLEESGPTGTVFILTLRNSIVSANKKE